MKRRSIFILLDHQSVNGARPAIARSIITVSGVNWALMAQASGGRQNRTARRPRPRTDLASCTPRRQRVHSAIMCPRPTEAMVGK